MSAPVPGQSISGVDRLLAIAECERLMYQYAYRLDHGIGHTVAELFTEDGEWTSPAIRSTGRDGLAAFFRRRDDMRQRVTRHVVTNIDVTVHSPERATARSVAIEYRGERAADDLATDTAPALVGDYEDEFRRVDGIWLFHRRNVVIAFKRSGEQFMRPVGE